MEYYILLDTELCVVCFTLVLLLFCFSVFRQLEKSSREQGPRPDADHSRLRFSGRDHTTLICYLNDKNDIDVLNDHFLSRFIFSIREHTNIVNRALDKEKRVKQLIQTMECCADKVFKDFCHMCSHILDKEHLLDKLEKTMEGDVVRQRQKRKGTNTYGGSPFLYYMYYNNFVTI